MVRQRFSQAGMTLVELLISLLLLGVLTASTAYVFHAILLVSDTQQIRSGLRLNLERGVEEMMQDLRTSFAVQSQASRNEFRIQKTRTAFFIYYLYNPADHYPPAFNQTTSYQLKRASLSAIDGTFSYGAGDVILNDVVSPNTTRLQLSGNLAVADVTVLRSATETLRIKTQVKPRNI